jgi:uncharacterized protein YgiM (DUF1202 family)
MKKLLALVLAALLCLAMAAPAFAAPKDHDWTGHDAVVTARALNLRVGPGTDNKIITSFPRGTKVDIIGFDGKWAEVVIGYGFKGWMHTDYLAFWGLDKDDKVEESTVESRVLPQP